MTEPSALDARAAALRVLADQVEDVVDQPLGRAVDPVWHCDHAEAVRDALREQRRGAGTAALRLREHARQLEAQAERVREERREQARREEARAKAEADRAEADRKAREAARS